MSDYFKITRAKFVYKLLSVLSFVPLLGAMILIVEYGYTPLRVFSLVISILSFIVCVKLYERYEGKLDRFNYKSYLDESPTHNDTV